MKTTLCHVRASCASPTYSKWRNGIVMLVLIGVLASTTARGSLAAWNFFDQSTTSKPATVDATTFSANFDSANTITRGTGAKASGAAQSFRTEGFKNEGISTANTDYFQTTLSPASGYTLSLSTIDAQFYGTASYAVSPGVSSQFAYSLDGINFTLIGSAFVGVGVATPQTMTTVDLTGIGALQNVPDSTTVTFRYYASGQTTTGGWGLYSSASGVDGLAFGGTINATAVPEPSTFIAGALLVLPFGVQGVRYLRNRKRA